MWNANLISRFQFNNGKEIIMDCLFYDFQDRVVKRNEAMLALEGGLHHSHEINILRGSDVLNRL